MHSSRQSALAAGEKTYYDGTTCKHGHTAYRYVKNGACSDCVKQRANLTAPPSPEDSARKAERERLLQVKIRAFASDLSTLKASALAFATMRFPHFQESDVYPNLVPTNPAGGTALYRFNCYQEDVEGLRSVANTLLAAHRVDLSETAAKLAEAAPRGTPPPPWRFT